MISSGSVTCPPVPPSNGSDMNLLYKPEPDSPPLPTSLYVTSPFGDRDMGIRMIQRANLPILNPGMSCASLGFPSSGTAFHPPGDMKPSL